MAPENGWVEDDPASFWGKRPIFRRELANVSFRRVILPYLGVSKNRATPKWMVKIMVPNPMKNGWFAGVFPWFLVWKHPFWNFPQNEFQSQPKGGWSSPPSIRSWRRSRFTTSPGWKRTWLAMENGTRDWRCIYSLLKNGEFSLLKNGDFLTCHLKIPMVGLICISYWKAVPF